MTKKPTKRASSEPPPSPIRLRGTLDEANALVGLKIAIDHCATVLGISEERLLEMWLRDLRAEREQGGEP